MRLRKLAVVILSGLLLAACSKDNTDSKLNNINNTVELKQENSYTNKEVNSKKDEIKNISTDKKEEEKEKNEANSKFMEEKKNNTKKEEIKEEIKNEGEQGKKEEAEKPKSEDEVVAEEGVKLFKENGYENMVFLSKIKLSSANITGVPIEIENRDIYQFRRENENEDKGYYYDNVNKNILQLDQGLWKLINEDNRFTNETYSNLNLSIDDAKSLIEEKIDLKENESIGELREVQSVDLEKIAPSEVIHNIYKDKIYIVHITDGTITEERYAICARTGFIYDIKSNWNRLN